MARRGARAVLILTSASRLIVAIVLQALAFSVWNVGTRGPAELWSDIRSAAAEPRRLARGIGLFVCGAILLAGGGFAVLAELPEPVSDFAPVETIAVVAALIVEFLIGRDFRALLHIR